LRRGSPISIRYSLSDDGGRLRVNAVEKSFGKSIDASVDTFNALKQMELDELKQHTGELNVQ
jgi:hypothetical protein